LLIIHADDLGISAGVNRAIFDAHARGLITSASLLMGGACIDDALKTLKSNSSLDVGVHLCLHDELPVAPPDKISSLVDKTGRLRPLGQVIKGIVTGQVKPAHIEAEYRAQVQRAIENGVRITHFDSHCHLHAFPPVVGAVAKVAKQFGIGWLRKPQAVRVSDYAGAPLRRYALSSTITACSLVSFGFIARGFHSPDRFIGLVHSGCGDTQWISESLRTLVAGSINELMVHPGDGSDHGGGREDNHGSWQRKAEYDVLLSDDLRAQIDDRKIRLVSYADLGKANDTL
jgi:predicted glycoside hydrolase/deacetylase ChbG (UPF0249 family)